MPVPRMFYAPSYSTQPLKACQDIAQLPCAWSARSLFLSVYKIHVKSRKMWSEQAPFSSSHILHSLTHIIPSIYAIIVIIVFSVTSYYPLIMKSLMIFTFSLSLLGAPVSAARLAEPAIQVHARAQYQGGWPLALMASETAGCPVEAPVQCQNNYTTLECCPGSQVCHIDATSEEQYCCPTGLSTPSLQPHHYSLTIVLTPLLIYRRRLLYCRFKLSGLRKLILDPVLCEPYLFLLWTWLHRLPSSRKRLRLLWASRSNCSIGLTCPDH